MSVKWPVMEVMDGLWVSGSIEVFVTWGTPLLELLLGKVASVRCRWLILGGAVQTVLYGALHQLTSLLLPPSGSPCWVFRSVKPIPVTACLSNSGSPMIFRPSIKPSLHLLISE